MNVELSLIVHENCLDREEVETKRKNHIYIHKNDCNPLNYYKLIERIYEV